MVHSLEHAHIWGIVALVTVVALALQRLGNRDTDSALFALLGSAIAGILTITIEALKHIGKDRELPRATS